MGPYYQSGSYPLALQSRMNGPGGSPAVPGGPGAEPYCGDWSGLCAPGEFAEAFDLTFNFFSITAGALAAGATRALRVSLTPEARFVAYAITGVTSVIPTTERVSYQIRDMGSQRFLSNAFVPAENGIGAFGAAATLTPVGPRYFMPPRMFSKISTIEIQITANANNGNPITECEFTLLGWKVYSMEALNSTARRCR
jgi:hypothetical protein